MAAGILAIQGMNKENGKLKSPQLEHIKQSIVDIVTTPIGSRLQRREYGSYLFHLIDKPLNSVLCLLICSVLIDAIFKWEPRVYISHAIVKADKSGFLFFEYQARTLNGDEINERLRIAR